ncbi:MAG: flagellar hook protein FlgE [Deltaproteobacteria bacterium]|nr:flagellar hook protein FlgE [Deltaproteobacteria bacterium]
MGNSLYTGITGLQAATKQMDVIGDNIANVNTVGFKSCRINFADLLSQSITGGSSKVLQVGRGVGVTDISTQFELGSFETTQSATDLAIDGNGFFVVENTDGGIYYTRAGAFHVNAEGFFVDANGLKVQGYNLTGANPNVVDSLYLQNIQSIPNVTTNFVLSANLNADTAAGETFTASQTVYDSLGGAHTLGLIFQKTEANGYWSVKASLDGGAEGSPEQNYYGVKFGATGALESVFNSTMSDPVITTAGDGAATATVKNPGQLYKATAEETTILLTRGADANSWTVTDNGGYENMTFQLGAMGADDEIGIDLDGLGGADVAFALEAAWAEGDTIAFTINQSEFSPADVLVTFGELSNGATIGNSNVVTWGMDKGSLTGYASSSLVKTFSNDGYAPGDMISLSIASDGTINGFFTNGQTDAIGKLVLADFPDPWGLMKMGSNLFAETLGSGRAIIDVPGSVGLGSITPNALEMSNTDIAAEFVNMITAQRAYQASAKVITTTDQMMAELMNLKR